MLSCIWAPRTFSCFFCFFASATGSCERSRAVASHGVGSRPYWIRMGTAVLVYAPSFNSGGTMGAGQARGPVRPANTEARQTEHWRGWGSIRTSRVRCLEKRLLVGNSRQEALWNVQRLYASEQTAAVLSCVHITLQEKKPQRNVKLTSDWPDSGKSEEVARNRKVAAIHSLVSRCIETTCYIMQVMQHIDAHKEMMILTAAGLHVMLTGWNSGAFIVKDNYYVTRC